MLRLVSFPRNSHLLRHLLSIKFDDEGTAVSIALVCKQAVAWSRHATKERVQWGNEATGSMKVSFFPTIIQTRVVIDHKARVSEFILDKLEVFCALH